MRLREIREAYNYTQEYVSEAIGVSRITYIRYENEERPIKGPELIGLSKLYNVSVDYLLGITDVSVYDTKKDPSPKERERAVELAAAAVDGAADPQRAIPGDLAELSELVRQIVDQALEERDKQTGDQS